MADERVVPSLGGKTIAITEARRAVELASLITKLGGVPYSAPAVREVLRRDQRPALDALDRICGREISAIIFLTGVGARALITLATEGGKRDALLAALQPMFVAARGPKPVAVLRETGVRIDLVPAEPTSEGLLNALAERRYDLNGKVVAVQLYGEGNLFLVEGLAARGATVLEIPLYEWALPEDQEPLIRLVHDVVEGRVDVVAFTSSPQIKHLFVVADRLGRRGDLAAALREKVTVAVIGPVARAALGEYGVMPRIEPEKGTMGALVHAIAGDLGRPTAGRN